ncbi:MAG: DUF2520 domain-containing protein [Bacteroidales bacterium]|nr:DUF2520 domain-containing protein [Bacteroidales bacterium]
MVNPLAMHIAFAGSGNVATHLAVGLHKAGCDIVAVASRSIDNARALADKVGAAATDDVSALPDDVDFIIISASDASVAGISDRLPVIDGVVVHTSGSVPVVELSRRHARAGVLYPLQTFSKDVPVDIAAVPFFTEGTDDDTLAAIDILARRLSQNVYHADSSHRRYLHVAGVLSSNFTVYLLEQCRRVLARGGYPLEVVRPLVGATLEKAFAVGPHDAMTGPARRGDLAVIEAQYNLAPDDLKPVYRLVSEQIYKTYNQDK